MKTETRLQIAALGRGAKLGLVIVVMIAWVVVILGMLPEREFSSPGTKSTSPSRGRSAAPVVALV